MKIPTFPRVEDECKAIAYIFHLFRLFGFVLSNFNCSIRRFSSLSFSTSPSLSFPPSLSLPSSLSLSLPRFRPLNLSCWTLFLTHRSHLSGALCYASCLEEISHCKKTMETGGEQFCDRRQRRWMRGRKSELYSVLFVGDVISNLSQ